MPTRVVEYFGVPVANDPGGLGALHQSGECPFLGARCTKRIRLEGSSAPVASGVCTLAGADGVPVICCPNRLYADDYRVLRLAATHAFGADLRLIEGPKARDWARENAEECVAVFGHRWGKELRVPAKDQFGAYSVDWILARISDEGELIEFIAVEVQTVDTTGNYRAGVESLRAGNGHPTGTRNTAGFNWENVNKRIIPQLMYKGQLLQRETLCAKGLFFLGPEPVLERIFRRLGGRDQLSSVPLQNSAITFMAFQVAPYADPQQRGLSLNLEFLFTTSVGEVQDAFWRVGRQNRDVYQAVIEDSLGPAF